MKSMPKIYHIFTQNQIKYFLDPDRGIHSILIKVPNTTVRCRREKVDEKNVFLFQEFLEGRSMNASHVYYGRAWVQLPQYEAKHDGEKISRWKDVNIRYELN